LIALRKGRAAGWRPKERLYWPLDTTSLTKTTFSLRVKMEIGRWALPLTLEKMKGADKIGSGCQGIT